MTLDQLTAFFGWMSIINIGLLFVAFFALLLMKPWALEIHQKIFDVDVPHLRRIYMKYFALHKILTIVLNIVPYFALKLVG